MTVLERAINNFPQVLCLTLGLSVQRAGKVGDNGQSSGQGRPTQTYAPALSIITDKFVLGYF